MKVDTVYIQRNDGIDVDSFNIQNIADARRHAANLSAYHGQEYFLVVRNEDRTPVKQKKIKLEKNARFWDKKIKVYHLCAVTGRKEKLDV